MREFYGFGRGQLGSVGTQIRRYGIVSDIKRQIE